MTKYPFYHRDRAARYENYAAEYVFEQTEPTAWTPLQNPLRQAQAALIVSAGLRLQTQHEFQIGEKGGSSEFRQISIHINPADLAYDFTSYDTSEVEKDLNVLAPVNRLKDLVDAEEIRGIHETFFSFFGLCPELEELQESALKVANTLIEAGVDVAFLVPANMVCNQTMGLVARTLERAGISTVTLSTAREITEQVKVPRSIFVNHPFGRTLGKAGDKEGQHAIMMEMVQALKSLQRPGKMIESAARWEGLIE